MTEHIAQVIIYNDFKGNSAHHASCKCGRWEGRATSQEEIQRRFDKHKEEVLSNPFSLNDMADIPAGAMIIVTMGSYSNYGISGLYRALKDIPVRALLHSYLERHPEQLEARGAFNAYDFFMELYKSELFDDLSYHELHLPEYDGPECVGLESHKSEAHLSESERED